MKRSAEGSVYKHTDGKRWVARLRYTDAHGRYREKKRLCLSRKLASLMITELREEVIEDKQVRKTYRQLDKFFRKEYVHPAKFISGQKVSGFRQPVETINHYLDAALEYFGDLPLEQITFEDLRKYRNEILKRPTIHRRQRSMSDTNHHLKRLRRILAVAVEQGWLEVNPFKRGSSLISDSFETERTRILSLDEEARLLKACVGKRRHLKALLVFAIETACRKNEIFNVKWSSVNLDQRFIRIEGFTTKTLKTRLVPITTRLADTLAQLWHNSRQKQSDLVFDTGDCKSAFLGALEMADLKDVHLHDLRHTAITRMLEKGISPPLVMKISGHSQMKTFLRYVNQSESSIFEIAKKLDMAA